MKNISAKNIGVITGTLMVLACVVMFYTFRLPETGSVSKYTNYGIYIAGILAALLFYKQYSKEEKTFKAFFSEGFKVFVIAVLFMAIFNIIFYKLNPQIIDANIKLINAANSADPNKTTAEVIENGEKLKNIFIPMTVAMNTLLYLILGALVTAIGAGFLSQPMLNENK